MLLLEELPEGQGFVKSLGRVFNLDKIRCKLEEQWDFGDLGTFAFAESSDPDRGFAETLLPYQSLKG